MNVILKSVELLLCGHHFAGHVEGLHFHGSAHQFVGVPEFPHLLHPLSLFGLKFGHLVTQNLSQPNQTQFGGIVVGRL